MSDPAQIDEDLKNLYVSTCSDRLRQILRDRGLVQPLSRTIIIGRIWYDLREEVRDHLSEIIAKVQADIPDEESCVTGILVVYLSFFYLVVEGSDEALGDILHGMADAVREGVVLKAKVIRTGGVADRFFNHYHTCVVKTPRYEEDEFLRSQTPVRKKSVFFDDSGPCPTMRRKSIFMDDSGVGRRMSGTSVGLPTRPLSADGVRSRQSICFAKESNLNVRRKSMFVDDTNLSVRRKSRQDSKLNVRRKSSFAPDSKLNVSRKSDSKLNVRRKSRFVDVIIDFEEEGDHASSIAKMLFQLEEAVFVLASCIRFIRPEEVEARLNELLPAEVLLNGEELSDLWREDFFLSVEEHIDRYFKPFSHTSFLEEEWPPTGPAHDPNDYLEEINRFEELVNLSVEEDWKKNKHSHKF